jgi:tetratricopeptide (TPR) repeat protein
MDIKQRLKAMLQEAEIYRSQGLIAEAYEKYTLAIGLITSVDKLKNKDSLTSAIQKKIESLDIAKDKVEKDPGSPELSTKAQDLIKNLFTFAEDKDEESIALEGAVTLAKFGQFDRALNELNVLLKSKNVRVDAAKNILRCYLACASADEAVNQYQKWFSSDIFQPAQLETIRVYLEDILQKRGIEKNLPSLLGEAPKEGESARKESVQATEADEEFLDITSIGITFESGPRKGKMVEFDVNFQSGNMLSLIISKQDQELIQDIEAGMKLKDIQFFSPIAIFNGAGIVSDKTQIKSGPKQGDFCLDVRIVSS